MAKLSKKITGGIFSLLVFAAIGALIYFNVLAIPLIITALITAAMPYGFAVFISILPLFLSIILAYKMLQFFLQGYLPWIQDLLISLGMEKKVLTPLQLLVMQQQLE